MAKSLSNLYGRDGSISAGRVRSSVLISELTRSTARAEQSRLAKRPGRPDELESWAHVSSPDIKHDGRRLLGWSAAVVFAAAVVHASDEDQPGRDVEPLETTRPVSQSAA